MWLLLVALGVHLDAAGPFASREQCEHVAARARAEMGERAQGFVMRCVLMQGARA